jgi:hypothetical protein
MTTEPVVIEAYEKAEQAIQAAADSAADEIATRAIARWHIKTIVDAAAPIIRRSHRFRTWMALQRITQAAEGYLRKSAEADDARRAELRQNLAEAATDAWMLLRPNSAGVGSDEDAPPAPQDEPGAANTPQVVAREGRNALRGSQAVPDEVLQAARAAAWPGLADQVADSPDDQIDAAVGVAWQAAAERLRHYQRHLDGAMHSVWLHANWTWLLTKMTTEQADAARAAQQRHQRILNAADDLGVNPAHVEEHDAAEPLHIVGYQPDPVPAESVLTLQDRANEAARQERAEANLAATIGAELDRGTAIREIFRSPAVQAAGFGISAAQASANIRKNLDAMLADSDTPPDLIPPADATSAAEFARIKAADPTWPPSRNGSRPDGPACSRCSPPLTRSSVATGCAPTSTGRSPCSTTYSATTTGSSTASPG